MAKVYAVVVTFNGIKWLDLCLGSLAKSEQPIQTIVIDNASTDGTPDYIEEHFPDVHLIRSEINYGFAKSNNIGIRYAYDQGADYIFLLNQDAYIEKHTLSDLCAVADTNDNVGIVSPIHMNGDGTALDWGFAGYLPSEFISDLYMTRLKGIYACSFINAAAWLIKRSCIETVGGFDTSMFVHYGEDSNYCRRMQFHNIGILVSTGSRIFHDRDFRKGNEQEYRNKVFPQSDLNSRLEYTDLRYDLDIDNMIKCNKVSIIKSYIKLNFRKVKRLRDFDLFLKKVKNSRNINSQGGLCWL